MCVWVKRARGKKKVKKRGKEERYIYINILIYRAKEYETKNLPSPIDNRIICIVCFSGEKRGEA